MEIEHDIHDFENSNVDIDNINAPVNDMDSGNDANSGLVDSVPPNKTDLKIEVNNSPQVLSVPSLRGTMRAENNSIICSGVWAMSDYAHGVPELTSLFEFRLVSPTISSNTPFPVNGKYCGWFMLKQPFPKAEIKVDDRDISLNFEKQSNDPNKYNVTGSGVNKFGKFTVYGVLDENNFLQMYRTYTAAKKVSSTPKAAANGTTPTSKAIKSQVAQASPRESSGRVRRPSLVHLTNSNDDSLPPPQAAAPLVKQTSSGKAVKRPSIAAPPAMSRETSASTSRAARTPSILLRCADLLKELLKIPQSAYFTEPVDYVKLNIPDYPTVILHPMDFQTIRINLENNKYATHEEYAEHVRLVFKNAIQYNTRRDNPVHIAAREMSNKFEEKYRIMLSQYARDNSYVTSDYDSVTTGKGSSSSSKKNSKSGKRPASLGPREISGGYHPPPVMDSSKEQLLQMQRKMMEMESEIFQLRTAVRHSEIRSSLETQRIAVEPLTREEKKLLISQILKLEGDKMAHVIEIIQAALPSSAIGESDEVEIPIEDLDNSTMRKLQEYVQANVTVVPPVGNVVKRKRPSTAASPAARSPRASSGEGGKRSKGNSSASVASVVDHSMISSSLLLPPPPVEAVLSAATYPSSTIMGDGDGHNARDRSSSVDFFDIDDISIETLEASSGVHNNSNNVWKMEHTTSSISYGQYSEGISGGNTSSGWGEAVVEKNDTLMREQERKLELEKLNQQRIKLEQEHRQLAYQQQQDLSDKAREDESLMLQKLREDERASRHEMEKMMEVESADDFIL